MIKPAYYNHYIIARTVPSHKNPTKYTTASGSLRTPQDFPSICGLNAQQALRHLTSRWKEVLKTKRKWLTSVVFHHQVSKLINQYCLVVYLPI